MKSVDVLIVGGGIVGYALAGALGRFDLSVMLLDPNKGSIPTRPTTEVYPASNRVFTIRPSVRDFLRNIGLWGAIDEFRSQKVSKMLIYSGADAPLIFDAYQTGFDQLATVVEYEELIRVTSGSVNTQSTKVVEAGFEGVTLDKDRVIVETIVGPISCKLLVGADGGSSEVRKAANIDFTYHDYEYTGVVASFSTARSHAGIAYQKFVDRSVIAFLPLPSGRTNLVWSLKNELARELNEGNILERVSALFNPLGIRALETSIGKFPLGKLKASATCSGRVALVGDSAHQFLPLAGQGLNVGLSDVQKLVELIAFFGQVDPGSDAVINRYRRARREEIESFSFVTGAIHESLISSRRIGELFRDTSLDLINHCHLAKRFLVNKAAGYDF